VDICNLDELVAWLHVLMDRNPNLATCPVFLNGEFLTTEDFVFSTGETTCGPENPNVEQVSIGPADLLENN